MVLDVKNITFQRNEEGQLLPVEMKLSAALGGETIKVRPVTRGKLQELLSKSKDDDPNKVTESDNEFIKIGLAEPSLTDDQIKDLKPRFATEFVLCILSLSLGMNKEELQGHLQKASKQQLLKSIEEEEKKK